MAIALRSRSARSQCGATLLEGLLAFLVLGLGAVAGVRLQSQLRFDADLARERTLAVRLGEGELEAARAYSTLAAAPGRTSYAEIVDATTEADPWRDAFGAAGATSYRIERRVAGGSPAIGKQIVIDAVWTDRRGAERRVSLSGFIAAVDPALAGALALGNGAIPTAVRGYRGRHPSVALDARDLGNGRSAWTPSPGGGTFLVDNHSGEIVARCPEAAGTATSVGSQGSAADCVAEHRLLLSGTVRFATPATAVASPGSVELHLLQSDRAVANEPLCRSEAMKSVRSIVAGSVRFDSVAAAATSPAGGGAWQETGDRYVAWRCLVEPSADASWSGRLELRLDGLAIGSTSPVTACRLPHAGDPEATNGANIAPMGYRHVTTALLAENFVIVGAGTPCPSTLTLAAASG